MNLLGTSLMCLNVSIIVFLPNGVTKPDQLLGWFKQETQAGPGGLVN